MVDHVGLLPKEAAHSTMKKEDASYYQHAAKESKALLCVLFKDFQLVDLNTDVIHVADVFANFRTMRSTIANLTLRIL